MHCKWKVLRIATSRPASAARDLEQSSTLAGLPLSTATCHPGAASFPIDELSASLRLPLFSCASQLTASGQQRVDTMFVDVEQHQNAMKHASDSCNITTREASSVPESLSPHYCRTREYRALYPADSCLSRQCCHLLAA